MLTYGFWQEAYDGRNDVVGESIVLDGVSHTIVGVMHPKLEFASFADAQVVAPLVLDPSDADRTRRSLLVSGRLATGVSHEMATEEVRRIGRALAEEYPAQNRGWELWAAPVRESLINADANRILLLLQLTVGMVILIACANVANMLLARASARSREIAVRSALGAGRSRLVRQLLTESLVISLGAAGLGLAFAYGLNRTLVWISAGTEPAFLMAELDARVLGFTLLVSLAAPLAFGLLPALRASTGGPSAALRDGRSGDGGRSGKRARGFLVTAQVSLALTLMVVATLLTRTVVNLQTRPLGFDLEGLLTVDVTLPEAGYGDSLARIRFFASAREELASIPDMGDVELTDVIPGAEIGARRSLVIEGVEVPEGRAAPVALFTTVSPGYFSLIGLPLESGRGFSDVDGPDAPRVAVVSREIARSFWPDETPLGRRIQIAGTEEWIEVVGIVADVRSTTGSERPAMAIYRPHDQDARSSMYLVSRVSADPAALAGPIRQAILGIDSDLPIDAIRTMRRAHYESSASDYALLTLFVTFAVFALVMAAIGIYGVMAYSVSQRRNEIGLRMALGAEIATVRWMVVSQGARLLALGIVIGLAAAFLMSRLLANLVFGISPTDPATFVGVPLVLSAVALFANLVPARRATGLDPAKTLRAE
jgi:putative ABC transport system permease protein